MVITTYMVKESAWIVNTCSKRWSQSNYDQSEAKKKSTKFDIAGGTNATIGWCYDTYRETQSSNNYVKLFVSTEVLTSSCLLQSWRKLNEMKMQNF